MYYSLEVKRANHFLEFTKSMTAQNIDLESSRPKLLRQGLPIEYGLSAEEIDQVLDYPEKLAVLNPWLLLPLGSLSSRAALQKALVDGNNVCATALQRSHWKLPRTRKSCQSLAEITGLPTFAALHITPAGQWGSGEHADTGWTLVGQLSGTKTWHLQSPLANSISDLANTTLPSDYVSGEHGAMPFATLYPNDVLFIPSGWRHAALAGEEQSVHLGYGGPYPDMPLGPIYLQD